MDINSTQKGRKIKRKMTSIKKRSKFARGGAVQKRPFDGLFSVVMQAMLVYIFLFFFNETKLLQRPDIMFQNLIRHKYMLFVEEMEAFSRLAESSSLISSQMKMNSAKIYGSIMNIQHRNHCLFLKTFSLLVYLQLGETKSNLKLL